ncbi:hypothetical protein C3L33_07597, partial [Rhododendron williamsianum]
MKVHGALLSTASQRVFACLYEKELDFEFSGFEDGDLKLFESRAINLYIAHAYADKGNQLIYPDGKKMAILSMWMEVEAHQFDPVASSLCWELAIKPMFGMTMDAAVVDEKEAKLGQVLDVYEARLAQSKYLGGDDFTLADLHHLPNIQLLMVPS